MRPSRFAWLACALTTSLTLVLGACGGGGGSGGDDDPDIDARSGDDPDADNTGFVEIVGRDWSIPPGETYRCVRVLVEEDILISTFRPISPDGTHHTVLTVSDSGQVGEYDCSAGALDSEMLYASGVGTDDLVFPEGVAIRVEAGRYLNLNLHLFNTRPSGNLDGHSGILARTVASVDPDKEAEMVFAGTFAINIPANSSGTASGGCTFDDPATIFTYWPHMHQYANHQTVTLTIGGTAMTLHDEAYSFEEQRNYPLATPIVVASGDRINVLCSYTNDTNQNVTFGDSSTTEMCFTGLYRYPKQAVDLFECSSPCSPTIGCPF